MSHNRWLARPGGITCVGREHVGHHGGGEKMIDREWLANEFERSRAHLHSIAYRMLGSPSEADDAVQEAWLRLDRTDSEAIHDLRAWLTTVVGRICLDMLRARQSRRTYSSDVWLP